MKRYPSQCGFSLLELIVVLVLLGILAGVGGLLIISPIEAYDAQVRRQQLVDKGEMALRQMAADVRRALPNSLRLSTVGSGRALEMVNVVDGARYRDEFGGIYTPNPNFVLDFISPDDSFNLLGTLSNPAIFDANNRLVIYSTSDNIYAEAVDPITPNEGIITPAGISLGVNNLGAGITREDQITLTTPFLFTRQSPGQRVFFIDGPISYICDPDSGRILRYSNYTFIDPQSSAPGGTSTTVVNQLLGCSMTYSPGTAQRGGILTIEIAIGDAGGESVNLLHQLHVENLP